MLSIVAESFRIATRTDRPWLSGSFLTEPRQAERRRRDRWFWEGGPARRIRDIE
jgi:hypothetical protein